MDDEAWADFLTFAAAFYANMGNFKSFGDIKIIPGLPAESFFAIIQVWLHLPALMPQPTYRPVVGC